MKAIAFASKLPACIMAREACCGAHHMGRALAALGHEVRLMSPGYVRPYVKAQKNDDRDAEAIAEDATRSTMRFVDLKLLKLSTLMDTAEEDVLAYMTFPAQHRATLHSTNPIECLNGEIKRRTDVVGIFPNEASIRKMVRAILMEQTEEWTVQRGRCLTVETLAPVRDDVMVSLPAEQRS